MGDAANGRVLRVSIVYEPDEEGWYVFAPALKGVHSHGATREEARKHIVEAIEVWLETATEHGVPIPETDLVEVSVT